MSDKLSKVEPVHVEVNEPVFDLRPLEFGGFRLLGRTAVPVGRPSLKGWVSAMQIAVGAHESSPYWIGDLLSYAESRSDWKEKLDQAVALTGYKRSTLHNLGYISRHVEEKVRQLSPSPSHSYAVAALPQEEQVEMLTKARDEDLTVGELKRAIISKRRTRIIEGQATLEGMFRIIYADPPWPYRDDTPALNGVGGRVSGKYPPMKLEEIIALPVAAHAMPNATLFMWATAPMLLENPGPREVLEAWGFEYKANIVWDKVLGMPGAYGLQVCHEHLIIATRGYGTCDVSTPAFDSVFTERRSDEHSEKPNDIRRFIESHWTQGPYLELFGREPIDGWKVFGNDARLWPEQAAS